MNILYKFNYASIFTLNYTIKLFTKLTNNIENINQIEFVYYILNPKLLGSNPNAIIFTP